MKLNFREKGIPKWVKHRLGVLFLIFIGALVFFQIVLNRGEEEKKVTMADATLPLVGVQTYDHTMGELHGYRTEMDACYMRDALIACTIDGSNVNLVTKVLYPDIAKKYGVSTPSVERGLRYGIQTVRKTNTPLYQEIFSAMLSKRNISNTVFIATLANYIRKLD